MWIQATAAGCKSSSYWLSSQFWTLQSVLLFHIPVSEWKSSRLYPNQLVFPRGRMDSWVPSKGERKLECEEWLITVGTWGDIFSHYMLWVLFGWFWDVQVSSHYLFHRSGSCLLSHISEEMKVNALNSWFSPISVGLGMWFQ